MKYIYFLSKHQFESFIIHYFIYELCITEYKTRIITIKYFNNVKEEMRSLTPKKF